MKLHDPKCQKLTIFFSTNFCNTRYTETVHAHNAGKYADLERNMNTFLRKFHLLWVKLHGKSDAIISFRLTPSKNIKLKISDSAEKWYFQCTDVPKDADSEEKKIFFYKNTRTQWSSASEASARISSFQLS